MKNNDLNTEDLLSTGESPERFSFTTDDAFSSAFFSEKEDFLKTLLSTESSYITAVSEPGPLPYFESKSAERIRVAESIAIHSWKNVENISARLIEAYDDIVVLECLIDKDAGIYQEREFRRSLFDGYDLVLGSLFYLRLFERTHEIRLEVHNDPNRNFENDFPTIDFKALFETSKLFKKP